MLRLLVRPAPGPAPRSAPVVGSDDGFDMVRSTILAATFLSLTPSLTVAMPSPPSTGITCSRLSTRSHSSPEFQGPFASPSPCEVLTYMLAYFSIPGSLPEGKLFSCCVARLPPSHRL